MNSFSVVSGAAGFTVALPLGAGMRFRKIEELGVGGSRIRRLRCARQPQWREADYRA